MNCKKNRSDIKGHILYILLTILGILLLLVFLFWVIVLKFRSPKGKGFIDLGSSSGIIWKMFESAKRGNIEGYIDSFAPESQIEIRDTLRSKGEEAFKRYLKETVADIKGISILSRGGIDSDNTGDQGIIRISVEIVSRNNNRLQVYNLKRVADEWKILNVSDPILKPQPVPYGKNVNE